MNQIERKRAVVGETFLCVQRAFFPFLAELFLNGLGGKQLKPIVVAPFLFVGVVGAGFLVELGQSNQFPLRGRTLVWYPYDCCIVLSSARQRPALNHTHLVVKEVPHCVGGCQPLQHRAGKGTHSLCFFFFCSFCFLIVFTKRNPAGKDAEKPDAERVAPFT
jgi:hypothetical protein